MFPSKHFFNDIFPLSVLHVQFGSISETSILERISIGAGGGEREGEGEEERRREGEERERERLVVPFIYISTG